MAIQIKDALKTVGGISTSGAITTTGNGSHSIGSTSNRFNTIIGTNIHVYDANAQHYASLRTTTVGTADTQGVGRLVAGNNVASGTAGNAKGQIILYGTNTGYTLLTPSHNSTSSVTVTLPSSTGTLPIMSKGDTSYWGMLAPDGGTSWIRTTTSGLIPYDQNKGSALGTSSWPFGNIYGTTIYEDGTSLTNKYAAKSHGTHLTIGTGASNAAAGNHTHSYLSLSGGTMTGKITTPNNAAGITIGDDVTICDRNVANFMVLEGSTATNGGIIFGSGLDTNIYRGGANILKTDDAFHAASVTVSDRYYISSSVGQSQLGVGDTDCYWYNKQAGRYFQFKNDGRICLSDSELYHRGHNIIDVADRSSGDSGFGNSNRPCGFIGRFPGWNSNCLYINTYSSSGTESKSYNDVKIKGNNVYIDGAMRCSSCYISNRRLTIADSAPGSPATGDIWIDT